MENILAFIVDWIRGVELTPVLSIFLILAFFFALVAYYLSGFKDRVENLTPGKRFFVLIFAALLIFGVYYIFWKAGKFDEVLSYPMVKNALGLIQEKLAGLLARLKN